MRTYLYIDGYNLYYGSLKSTPYKWLDLHSLFQKVLSSHHDIVKIKYFTAKVSARPGNPSAPIHQQTYIRALQKHTDDLEVILGHYMSHKVMMPLARPLGNDRYVQVIKTEEKGSDVNLAVHALNDAWLDRYDCAVIVSNDSDLAEALCIIKDRGKRIGLVTPGAIKSRPTSPVLRRHADFIRRIHTSALVTSQLPSPIPGTTLVKPHDW